MRARDHERTSELKRVLENCLDGFLHTLAQVHKSKKAIHWFDNNNPVDLTDEELSEFKFATGQAGGAEFIQLPTRAAVVERLLRQQLDPKEELKELQTEKWEPQANLARQLLLAQRLEETLGSKLA